MPKRLPAASHRGDELRAYLAAQENDLYGLIAGLFHTAAAITRGEQVSFPRYLLPDDHPQRWVGGNCDAVTLTAAGDVLEPAR